MLSKQGQATGVAPFLESQCSDYPLRIDHYQEGTTGVVSFFDCPKNLFRNGEILIMFNQLYHQNPQVQIATAVATKPTNPFWYREQTPQLIAVTHMNSNMNLGIEDISLKPASANQAQYGILANGLLRCIIGTVSFQVRLSKAGAPFVQTASSEIDKTQGKYWEHIVLKAPVKAQILRFFEASQGGVAVQQQTANPYMQHQMMNPYTQQQAVNPYAQVAPTYGQTVQQQQAPAMDPAAMMSMLQQLMAQQTGQTAQQEQTQATETGAPASEPPAEQPTEEVVSDIPEEEMPI